MIIEKVNKKSIKEAIDILVHGGIVVFPTETSYGIGCDATNKKVIEKIFKIKQRSKLKNLPVICGTKKMVGDFFQVSKKEQELAKKYWPGPLSIVLSLRGLADLVGIRGNPMDNVPVRVSSNKVAQLLSKGLKKPITATSANISGEEPFYNAQDIFNSFKNKKYKPDLILDAGKIFKKKPSTIVELIDDKIFVIRQGDLNIGGI